MADLQSSSWQVRDLHNGGSVAVTDPALPPHYGGCVALVQGRSPEEKRTRARILAAACEMLRACEDTQILLTELKMGIGPATLRRKAIFARLDRRIERILAHCGDEEGRA